MKTQLKIHMLGSSFSIQTDETAEHMEQVLTELSRKILEMNERNPGNDPVKIALLVALNLTDENIHLKKARAAIGENAEASGAAIEMIAKKLIDRIDSALGEQ
jgi:cell division protein ZapA (FtsZ GTPase activity inhibitor)